MARWVVYTNDGGGWQKVAWAGSFKQEEDAWDFIYEHGNSWEGDTRAFEEDEE